MNPNAANKGRSFKGAIAYIIHDPDRAETDERVLFVETRNLRTDDPEKAAKVMAYTAKHAAELKAAAGIKATGRKTDSPVYHLSLSWVPGEDPSQSEMMEAGEAALRAIGFEDHEAVYAAHGDKAHKHLHIVVNRVHPVTGKTHNPKDDQKLLQAWGHEYDKARGLELRSPERAARHEKDEAKRAEYQRIAEAGREKKGAANDNARSRADYDAAKGATHPKSRRYQEIAAEFGGRAKALAAESRALYQQHRQARTDLAARHRLQRSALARPGQAAALALSAFETAAGSAPRLSSDDFRAAVRSLKTSQRVELRKLQAQQRARVGSFDEKEKAASDRLARNLQSVVQTSVGKQGPEHRGHLAARFKHEAELPRRAEQAGIAGGAADLAALQASQAQALTSLQGQQRSTRRPRVQEKLRHAKTSLAKQQRDERRELLALHKTEWQTLQARWGQLNDERAQAWDGYRAQRAEQMAGKGQEQRDSRTLKDIYAERSGLFESRRIEGRDYSGKGIEPGCSQGGGREIKKP